MRTRRGWTLVEMLVAMGLGSLILLVVTSLFQSTNQVTQVQTQRALLQGQLQAIMWELEQSLLGTCSAGIAWQPAVGVQPAILVAHPTQEGAVNLLPKWSPYWRCFIWDSPGRVLYLKQIPPGPPLLTAPAVDKPQIPTGAEMVLLASNPAQGARRLSDTVSQLNYRLDVGPLVRISVQLEKSLPNRAQPEKYYAERLFQLRNRI